MKTIISCQIDNLIRGYCSNFLSYLYAKNGWKRAVFETCKENSIPGGVEEIRILISNTGNIKLTCHSLFDILTALEYIEEQFAYARMSSYIVMDTETIFKTFFITEVIIQDYCFEETIFKKDVEGNSITLYKDIATFKYNNREDFHHLLESFLYFLNSDDSEEEVVETVDSEEEVVETVDAETVETVDDETVETVENIEILEDRTPIATQMDPNKSEKLILSCLFIYSFVRLAQLL